MVCHQLFMRESLLEDQHCVGEMSTKAVLFDMLLAPETLANLFRMLVLQFQAVCCQCAESPSSCFQPSWCIQHILVLEAEWPSVGPLPPFNITVLIGATSVWFCGDVPKCCHLHGAIIWLLDLGPCCRGWNIGVYLSLHSHKLWASHCFLQDDRSDYIRVHYLCQIFRIGPEPGKFMLALELV